MLVSVVLVTQLCPTTLCSPMTVAQQAPQAMGFPRQEYWSGLPFPFPGYLPDPGIKSKYRHYRQILYHLSHQRRLIISLKQLKELVSGKKHDKAVFEFWM